MRLPLAILAAAALAACATQANVTPAQQALNTTAATCKDVDAAIVAADAAVRAGTLKGNDARNAVKGLASAQAGCVAALAAIQAANAAATPGATK